MASTQSSGTRDVTYDLISVIYHALQGAETYHMYIEDAESSSDNDAATFFREAQQQNRQLANRAKELLATRLQGNGQGQRSG